MDNCEFCAAKLPSVEPHNVALLQHVKQNEECNRQYEFLLENLRSSWTVNMSGG